MNNYKFRGKTANNWPGEWVYGFLVKDCKQSYIYNGDNGDFSDCGGVPIDDLYSVRPETVGQFKGFDKNGKELYVGDIISDEKSKVLALICFGKIIKEVISDYDKKIKTVEIHGFYYKDLQANRDVLNQAIYPDDKIAFYVGNIHDNPELLGGK